MKGWFTWRTAVGSGVLGAVFTAALFGLSGRAFALSGLDLFFALTTVASLGFNSWQLFRDRYKYSPLKDSLVGLFNDLKGRQLRAFQRQMLITAPAGLALPVEAVRIEFFDFVQETIQGLDQLREHVVAAIHTLDPEASASQVFRAAEFGLTEQERRFRNEGTERFIENARRAASGSPQSHSPTSPQASSHTDP